MRPQQNRQSHLFEADRTPMPFPVALRRELVRLIECLLSEAVAVCVAKAPFETPGTKEAGHEQDHA